jgi:large subunit ribosomal protein L45
MYGNELTGKDVLEYVVFEKHLSNMYGTWRIHGKIIPEWSGVGIELESPRTLAL